MKLNKSSQLLLASAVSLATAGFLSACATLTTDFVFVSSAKAAGTNNYGEIDVYEVNSESGVMRQIPTSPFPSGGRNPVAETVSSDETNLYVVNRDDNTIVQFIIGNDGKVYPQNTVNTPGIFPIATAVSGTNLFVVDTYQPLPTCSTASPCTGSIAMYPIQVTKNTTAGSTSSTPVNGTLGSPAVNSALNTNYWPLTLPSSPTDIILPTSVAAPPSGSNVYVSAYDTTSGVGYVFAFAVANGTLSPVNNGVPVAAGIYPSGIASDPTGAYVYVTDSSSDRVFGFAAGSGSLAPLPGSPYNTGNQPSAVVVDAKGLYAYVANSQDSTITAYTLASGVLTRIGSYTTGTQPVAIGIDPSLNEFLYTANFLGNSVSGFQIQADSGSLVNSKGTPFIANANPTAVAAIPHGATSKQ
ncbi:lactonase family protein [Terracidiphilus gabretensis]|uniref:lactonase family protein n=1 Tax=Terracidiphilus gabretensis TaxID=1577687 RepID=UPI0018D25937|nr:beta-propeller fold lactonase family protein [Terracidiphilus gabretensis]